MIGYEHAPRRRARAAPCGRGVGRPSPFGVRRAQGAGARRRAAAGAGEGRGLGRRHELPVAGRVVGRSVDVAARAGHEPPDARVAPGTFQVLVVSGTGTPSQLARSIDASTNGTTKTLTKSEAVLSSPGTRRAEVDVHRHHRRDVPRRRAGRRAVLRPAHHRAHGDVRRPQGDWRADLRGSRQVSCCRR